MEARHQTQFATKREAAAKKKNKKKKDIITNLGEISGTTLRALDDAGRVGDERRGIRNGALGYTFS